MSSVKTKKIGSFLQQIKEELQTTNKFFWYQILSFIITTVFVVISFFNESFVYVSAFMMLVVAIGSFFIKGNFMPFNLVMYFFPFCAVIFHGSFNVYSTLIAIISLIGCLIWFFQIIKKDKPFNISRFVCFAVACLYCFLLYLFKFYSFSMCISIEAGLLFLFTVYNNKENIDFKQSAFSLIIGLLVSCMIAIFGKSYPRLSSFYHVTYALGSLRFSALFPNTNAFALLLLFVIGAVFVLYLNKQIKYLFYPVYLLILSFAFATVSKTVFVILLIGIPLFILFQLVKPAEKKDKLKFISAIIVTTILAILTQLIDFELITERMFAPFKNVAENVNQSSGMTEETTGEYFLNELTTGRLQLWIDSIKEICNNFTDFLFGHRLGGEYSIGGPGSNTLSSPHNTYLQAIYHIGLIGFIFIISSVLCDVRKNNLKTFNKNAIVFVIIFVLLMGVLDNFSYIGFIFIALVAVSLRRIDDSCGKSLKSSITEENTTEENKYKLTIPKKLHYIWLGGNPLPPIAEKCIESWKKFCPDYEIKRWDESNLDIDITKYSRTAYDMRKFAFASDVLRFDILNREGGIYLDIDVEIIKNIDKFLENELFCGFESEDYVNPGIILGAKPGHKIIKDTLESYKTREFIYDPTNQITVCNILTNELVKCGMNPRNSYQEHKDFTVYPMEYFCPKSLVDGKIRLTENSHGIHHFAATWVKTSVKIKSKIMQIIKRILGEKMVAKLKSKRTRANIKKDGEKKRVLHLLASNKFSGAENVACQVINSELNSDFEFAYASPEGEINDSLNDRNIKFLPLNKFSRKELKKVIKQFNPDIIHAHDMKATILALLMSKKIKVVAHIHRNHPDMRKKTLRSLIFKHFSKRKNLKHIFWVSDNAFADYVFNSSIKEKSSILYNIVDPFKYYELADKAEERDEYDLVFLGRLVKEKNPTRLLDIIALTKKEFPQIKVAIIGDGELYAECDQKITDLNLKDNIIMYGFMKNAYGILKRSKIFIITSITEGNPMALLEAQVFGLPIVSSELEPIHKLVESGETGYFFNNDEEAAKKIGVLLKDQSLYDEMKLKVLEFSKKYNNIDKYNNCIKDVYLK